MFHCKYVVIFFFTCFLLTCKSGSKNDNSDTNYALYSHEYALSNNLVTTLTNQRNLNICLEFRELGINEDLNEISELIKNITIHALDKWYAAMRFHPSWVDSNSLPEIFFQSIKKECDNSLVTFKIVYFGNGIDCSKQSCRPYASQLNSRDDSRKNYLGTIFLFNDIDKIDSNITHELGHLMGLNDTYLEGGYGVTQTPSMMSLNFHNGMGNSGIKVLTDDDRLGVYNVIDYNANREYACANNYIEETTIDGHVSYCNLNSIAKVNFGESVANAYYKINEQFINICTLPKDVPLRILDENDEYALIYGFDSCINNKNENIIDGTIIEFRGERIPIRVRDIWIKKKDALRYRDSAMASDVFVFLAQAPVFPLDEVTLDEESILSSQISCYYPKNAQVRVFGEIGNLYKVALNSKYCPQNKFGYIPKRYLEAVSKSFHNEVNIMPYGLISCPKGFQVSTAGPLNTQFCINSNSVVGQPLTNEILKLCNKSSVIDEPCDQHGINKDDYSRWIGIDFCPLGLKKDRYTGFCYVEKNGTNIVYQRLHKILIDECLTLASVKKEACESSSLPLEIVRKVFFSYMKKLSVNYYPDEPHELIKFNYIVESATVIINPNKLLSPEDSTEENLINEMNFFLSRNGINGIVEPNSNYFINSNEWNVKINLKSSITLRKFFDLFKENYGTEPRLVSKILPSLK